MPVDKPEPQSPEVGVTRPRRWLRWASIAGVLLLIIVALLPTLAKPWVSGQITAALPGHSNVGSMRLSWWSAVTIDDVTVSPDEDASMLSIGKIDTGKSLLDLIRSPNVELLRLSDVELNIREDGNSTNLERWIQQFPASSDPTPPIEVHIDSSRVQLFSSSGNQPEVVLDAVEAQFAMDGDAFEVTASGVTTSDSRTRSNENPLTLDASWNLSGGTADVHLQGFDLATAQVWLRRLDPTAQVSGLVTVEGSVQWKGILPTDPGPATISGSLKELRVEQLEFQADPSTLGSIQLERGQGHADFSFLSSTPQGPGKFVVDGSLACDAGQLIAERLQLDIPHDFTKWQHVVTSLRGQGSVEIDLPRAIDVAPQLLPLQDDVQLASGRVSLSVAAGTETHETISLSTQLDNIKVLRANQPIGWDKPVVLAIDVRRDSGIQIENLQLDSDFLTARFHGALEKGNGTISGDLAQLHGQLSQWLDLPVERLGGQISGDLRWNLEEDLVVGRGTLDILDAIVQPKGQTAWEDPRLHVQWDSRATLENNAPEMLSAELHVTTSTSDEIHWTGKRSHGAATNEPTGERPTALATGATSDTATSDTAAGVGTHAGLNWSGNGRVALEHLPHAADGPDSQPMLLSGTLRGNISGISTQTAVENLDFGLTIEDLVVEGGSVSVREPTVIASGAGRIDFDSQSAKIDRYDFTSTTVAFAGEALDVTWHDGPGLQLSIAARSDLSKLDRWIPSTSSDRYRWEGEFVGTVSLDYQADHATASWNGHVDRFAMRRIPVGGVATGIGRRDDRLWDEERLTTSGTVVFLPEEDSVTTDLLVEGDGVQLKLNGSVNDVARLPVADFEGAITYDYRPLQPKLQRLLGPSIEITGRGEEPITIRGPLVQPSIESPDRPVVPRDLKATAGFGWSSATSYGIAVGQGRVRAELQDSVVTFSPIQFDVASGRIHAEPLIDLQSSPGTAMVKPGQIMQNVQITPEMCRTWIRFVAPLLANATRAEGEFTAELDHAKLPLGDPAAASTIGTLQIHEGRVGAGPLVNEILAVASQVRSIVRQQPAQFDPTNTTEWVTLPQQNIDFVFADGAMEHHQFQMRVQEIHLTTSGRVDMDQNIDIVCEVPIREEWIRENGLFSSLRGKSILIPIRGTLNRPRLDRRALTDLGKQMLRGAAEDLLRDQLQKGLRGLFQD